MLYQGRKLHKSTLKKVEIAQQILKKIELTLPTQI
jgi:hypothetical protein